MTPDKKYLEKVRVRIAMLDGFDINTVVHTNK
jgi:hypothetical protein